jgi:GTP-binding protein
MGITELKDLLWREINDENNINNNITITHRKLDVRHRVEEEDNFIFEFEDEEEKFMPETDEEWEDEFWDEESSVND